MSRETKASKQEREKAAEDLRGFIKPGMTVYTTLRHRASSGMFRVIDLHVIIDNEPRWIGYTAATAMGGKYDDRRQGIKASGCGMDMGFHLVYNLSRTLYRDAFFCLGGPRIQYTAETCPGKPCSTECDHATVEKPHGGWCPSNDHSNDRYKDGDKSNAVRYSPTRKHSDGGYALRHRWM